MSDEIFRKMADCPEIQGKWGPKVGDWTNKGLITSIGKSSPYNGPQVDLYFMNCDICEIHAYQKHELRWLPSETNLWLMIQKTQSLNWVDAFLGYEEINPKSDKLKHGG